MVTGFGDEDQVVDDGTSDGVFAEGEVVEEDHREQVVITPKKETLALPPQKAPAPPPSTKQEVANCFGFDSVSFFQMRISFKPGLFFHHFSLNSSRFKLKLFPKLKHFFLLNSRFRKF